MVETLGTQIETKRILKTMKIYTQVPRRTADPVLLCSTIAGSGDIMATCSRGSFCRTLIAIFAGVVSLTLLSGEPAAQTTAKASGVKENGVLLQQELGGRATLINVPGAGHLLPLEKTQTTASHMISFIRQLDGKS
jgi:hypothetical protein